MRSNAEMTNGQGDVDLRFAQFPPPQLTLWLGLVPTVCHTGFIWRMSIGIFRSEVKVKFRNAMLLKILVLYFVVLCALEST